MNDEQINVSIMNKCVIVIIFLPTPSYGPHIFPTGYDHLLRTYNVESYCVDMCSKILKWFCMGTTYHHCNAVMLEVKKKGGNCFFWEVLQGGSRVRYIIFI